MHIGTLFLPLDLWCLGFVVMANFMAAWFLSNFPQHLWNLWHKGQPPIYTKDDLTTAAITRYGVYGDLWVCPLCLGTWFSFAVSNILACANWFTVGQAFPFVVISTVTWPVCFYILYGILKRV